MVYPIGASHNNAWKTATDVKASVDGTKWSDATEIWSSLTDKWILTWERTDTVLTVDDPDIVLNQVITLTAVTTSRSGGQIQFQYLSGTSWINVGSPVTISSGRATQTDTPPLGGRTYRARFVGTMVSEPSNSNTIAVSVVTVPTVTALAVTPNPLTFGQTFTLTATVSTAGTSASMVTTGTVQFDYSVDDGDTWIQIGSPVPLSGTGTASRTDKPATGGDRKYRATYAPVTPYVASTSSIVTATVDPAVTSITLSVSPSSITYGASVILTADSSATFGQIQFQYLSGSTWTNIGSAVTMNASGVATRSDTPGDAGITTYRAQTVASSSYQASTSNQVALTVNKQNTSVSLSASPMSGTYPQMITLTATPTSGATGSVTFYGDGASLGTGTISLGKATYRHMYPQDDISYTAVYTGDTDYNASPTSNSVRVSIARKTTGTYSRVTRTGWRWCQSSCNGSNIYTWLDTGDVYVTSFRLQVRGFCGCDPQNPSVGASASSILPRIYNSGGGAVWEGGWTALSRNVGNDTAWSPLISVPDYHLSPGRWHVGFYYTSNNGPVQWDRGSGGNNDLLFEVNYFYYA